MFRPRLTLSTAMANSPSSVETGTMLAARYATDGAGAGLLEVVEIPRPTPAPGEVLVRVRVSGADTHKMHGVNMN